MSGVVEIKEIFELTSFGPVIKCYWPYGDKGEEFRRRRDEEYRAGYEHCHDTVFPEKPCGTYCQHPYKGIVGMKEKCCH